MVRSSIDRHSLVISWLGAELQPVSAPGRLHGDRLAFRRGRDGREVPAAAPRRRVRAAAADFRRLDFRCVALAAAARDRDHRSDQLAGGRCLRPRADRELVRYRAQDCRSRPWPRARRSTCLCFPRYRSAPRRRSPPGCWCCRVWRMRRCRCRCRWTGASCSRRRASSRSGFWHGLRSSTLSRGVRSRSFGAAIAVSLIVLAGYAGVRARERRATAASQFQRLAALSRYATFDASFRTLDDALADRPPTPTGLLRVPAGELQRASCDPDRAADHPAGAGVSRAPSERPNVFLFVFDSLRPDYLSAYNAAVNVQPVAGRPRRRESRLPKGVHAVWRNRTGAAVDLERHDAAAPAVTCCRLRR